MMGGMGGALMGGAMQGVTDMLNSALGAVFARQERKAQQNFAARMFENRYQMTVRDLRKAGLNPMLAVTGGALGGGSVPSTAQASRSPIRSDVMSAARIGALMREEYNRLQGETMRAGAQADLADEQARTTQASRAHVVSEAKNAAELRKQQAVATALENKLRAADAAFYGSPTGGWLRGAKRVLETVPAWLGGAGAGAVSAYGTSRGLEEMRRSYEQRKGRKPGIGKRRR